jgi:hypothetical protein
VDLLDTILSAQGGGAVQQLADRFGLNQGDTASAVKSLLPALAAGLQRNVSQPGGLEGLLGALAQGGHQQYLDNPQTLGHPATVEDGNGILGHVLGSKDVSRQVATHAASETGLDSTVLKQMLPLVASLAMAALSKHAASSNGQPTHAGVLGMLGPLLGQSGTPGSGMRGMIGRLLG